MNELDGELVLVQTVKSIVIGGFSSWFDEPDAAPVAVANLQSMSSATTPGWNVAYLFDKLEFAAESVVGEVKYVVGSLWLRRRLHGGNNQGSTDRPLMVRINCHTNKKLVTDTRP